MPKSRAQTFFRGAALIWSVVALVAHSDTGVAFPLWMLLFASLLVLAIGWGLGLCDRRAHRASAGSHSP